MNWLNDFLRISALKIAAPEIEFRLQLRPRLILAYLMLLDGHVLRRRRSGKSFAELPS
jgi:hypothetical protein